MNTKTSCKTVSRPFYDSHAYAKRTVIMQKGNEKKHKSGKGTDTHIYKHVITQTHTHTANNLLVIQFTMILLSNVSLIIAHGSRRV